MLFSRRFLRGRFEGSGSLMALSEFETRRLEKLVGAFVQKHRPPPHLRAELDLGFRVAGQSVEIFEVRPRWRGEPGEVLEHPVAKATYVRVRNTWKVFWQRADLKWHSYPEAPTVPSIERFLEVVEQDRHCCFFG